MLGVCRSSGCSQNKSEGLRRLLRAALGEWRSTFASFQSKICSHCTGLNIYSSSAKKRSVTGWRFWRIYQRNEGQEQSAKWGRSRCSPLPKRPVEGEKKLAQICRGSSQDGLMESCTCCPCCHEDPPDSSPSTLGPRPLILEPPYPLTLDPPPSTLTWPDHVMGGTLRDRVARPLHWRSILVCCGKTLSVSYDMCWTGDLFQVLTDKIEINEDTCQKLPGLNSRLQQLTLNTNSEEAAKSPVKGKADTPKKRGVSLRQLCTSPEGDDAAKAEPSTSTDSARKALTERMDSVPESFLVRTGKVQNESRMKWQFVHRIHKFQI